MITYIYFREKMMHQCRASDLQAKLQTDNVECNLVPEADGVLRPSDWLTLTDGELIIIPHTPLRWFFMQVFDRVSLGPNFVEVMLGSGQKCFVAVNHFSTLSTTYMVRL